ncbi:MAG: hypothetical protein QNK37_30175 [Acidobacteriota bacterium]|nr:hypothetical protein [Acidobacteriota bacterium]
MVEVKQQAGDQTGAQADFNQILNRARKNLGSGRPDTRMIGVTR